MIPDCSTIGIVDFFMKYFFLDFNYQKNAKTTYKYAILPIYIAANLLEKVA